MKIIEQFYEMKRNKKPMHISEMRISNGELIGTIDIDLKTDIGEILKTLLSAGCNVSFNLLGTGTTVNRMIEHATYKFEGIAVEPLI